MSARGGRSGRGPARARLGRATVRRPQHGGHGRRAGVRRAAPRRAWAGRRTARSSTRCAQRPTPCWWARARSAPSATGASSATPAARSGRAARGLAPDPLLCVVSGRLDLPGRPALPSRARPARGRAHRVRRRPGAPGRRRARDGPRAAARPRRRARAGCAAGAACAGCSARAAHAQPRPARPRARGRAAAHRSRPPCRAPRPRTIVAPGLPEPRPLGLERALEHEGALLLSYAVGA